MVDIPRQLRKEGVRFIKIIPNSKRPLERWKEQNYSFDNINAEDIYGVICGYNNLRVIDVDNPDVNLDIDTLTIKTPSGGKHYYIYSDYNESFNHSCGEYRAKDQYVIGANSLRDEKKYEIIKDCEIKTLTKEEILALISPVQKRETITPQTNTKEFLQQNVIDKLSTNDKEIISNNLGEEELISKGFKSRSERDARIVTILLLKGLGEYIYPIFETFPCGDKFKEHSDGKRYLDHQIEKGREYTGVNNDNFIKLDEKINTLDERLLRNKVDEILLEIGKEDSDVKKQYLISRLAFEIKIDKYELRKQLRHLSLNKPKNPVLMSDLIKKEIKEIEFYLEPLIPSGGKLMLIGGKPGKFKSFFVLALILSMISNHPFIGKFNVKKIPKILMYFFDGDGEDILIDRVKHLQNGGIIPTDEQMKNLSIEFNFNKGNLQQELDLAKNYDIIILDSFRRFLSGAENDSEVTDAFYQNFLKKLKEMGKTIIVIHHFKKDQFKNMRGVDLMDSFRGSSDLASQFDLIFGVSASNESLSLDGNINNFTVFITKVKNRLGIPLESFAFKVTKNQVEKSTKLEPAEYKPDRSPRQVCKDEIVDFLKVKGEVERDEVIKLFPDLSSPTIDKYLKELSEEQLIYKPKHGYYALRREDG
jgi:archaellum biogenesis ATPase FlaH